MDFREPPRQPQLIPLTSRARPTSPIGPTPALARKGSASSPRPTLPMPVLTGGQLQLPAEDVSPDAGLPSPASWQTARAPADSWATTPTKALAFAARPVSPPAPVRSPGNATPQPLPPQRNATGYGQEGAAEPRRIPETPPVAAASLPLAQTFLPDPSLYQQLEAGQQLLHHILAVSGSGPTSPGAASSPTGDVPVHYWRYMSSAAISADELEKWHGELLQLSICTRKWLLARTRHETKHAADPYLYQRTFAARLGQQGREYDEQNAHQRTGSQDTGYRSSPSATSSRSSVSSKHSPRPKWGLGRKPSSEASMQMGREPSSPPSPSTKMSMHRLSAASLCESAKSRDPLQPILSPSFIQPIIVDLEHMASGTFAAEDMNNNLRKVESRIDRLIDDVHFRLLTHDAGQVRHDRSWSGQGSWQQ